MSVITSQNVVKEPENNNPWPDNYYLETEPEKRLEILDGREKEAMEGGCDTASTAEENAQTGNTTGDSVYEINKMREMFSLRYKESGAKKKEGKSFGFGKSSLKTPVYFDKFMGQIMELFILASMKGGPSRRGRKDLEKVMSALLLDKTKLYGEELIYRELCNLVGRYILISLDDKSFRSVILGIGRMSDEKAAAKVKNKLYDISVTVPEKYDVKDEFALFRRAVVEMQGKMLG